jgi:hypothetical protein
MNGSCSITNPSSVARRREPFQHTSDLHGLPFPFAGRGRDTAFIQRLRDASQRRYAGRLHGLDDRPEVGGVSACALGSALPAGGAGRADRRGFLISHSGHESWSTKVFLGRSGESGYEHGQKYQSYGVAPGHFVLLTALCAAAKPPPGSKATEQPTDTSPAGKCLGV